MMIFLNSSHYIHKIVTIPIKLENANVGCLVGMIHNEVPQILINREPLPQIQFDVELYGNSDTIVAQLSSMMGPDFAELSNKEPLVEVSKVGKDERADEQDKPEISEPKSEHDVEALKACWEPKTAHNLANKLPGKFLN